MIFGARGTRPSEIGTGTRQRDAGGLRRFVEIILVAAGEMPEPAVLDAHDVVRQHADEMHVVTDENQRAFKRLQRLDERVHTRQVEMRCRLVISSRFGGSSSNFTSASRLFSPPLSTLTGLNTSSPRNKKLPSTVRTNCSETRCGVSSASCNTVWLRLSMAARCCAK